MSLNYNIILPSYAKINLTLRIINKRPDGFHDLISCFYKFASGEAIKINSNQNNNNLNSDHITCNFNIAGENLILKALRLSRESDINLKIPFMDIDLFKIIPPGSGLGAGSGNAAAILNYISRVYGLKNKNIPAETGADVKFLYSGFNSAIVSGIGDELEKIILPEFHGVILIPNWNKSTGNAYNELDKILYGNYISESDAREELKLIINNLSANKKIGLLPNDFNALLLNSRPEYYDLFKIFDANNFLAWGITGSGSSAFGIFEPDSNNKNISWPDYVNNIIYF